MKKKWKILVVVVGLAVIGVVWFFRGPKEPEYQGKTLSEWMGSNSSTSSFTVGVLPGPPNVVIFPTNDAQRAAYKNIGSNALPFIRSMLLKKDSRLRDKLDPLVQRVPWLKGRFPTAKTTRERAMGFIAYFNYDWAIPMLIEMCRDEHLENDVVTFAISTFFRFPEASRESLPVLERYEKSANGSIAACARLASERIHDVSRMN